MRRWFTGVAAIAVAAGSLTACADSSGGPSHAASPTAAPATTAELTPADALNAAYTKTSAASTMQVAISGSMDVEGQHLPITGTGGVDVKGRRMAMSMRMGSLGTVEMRMLGTTFYEKLPRPGDLASSPYAGKWISVTVPAGAQTAGSFDPRQTLSFLKEVTADGIHQVGTAAVRGDSTTHYTAQLDLTKVMDKAQQQLGSSTSLDLTQFAKQMGMSRLPMDIYIDGQHLVRRVAMTLQLTAPSSAGSDAGQHAAFAITEDFYGYGTPVSVVQPPADQVVDGSGLLHGSLPTASAGRVTSG
jgi:hypothetical protein